MNGILLIAEQPDIVKTFKSMLAPAYDVRCVDTPEAGLAVLRTEHSAIVAVLVELAVARRSGFLLSEWMKAYTSFSLIPMIAISDELPTSQDMDCIEHGYFDLITAYAPRTLVYKRIANAIRAKDSLSLTQLEKMLKQLPSCIFLKDTEGRYVFSTQIWHHLDTEGDPNWTIRGKTDLEIRKDKDNARKAMEADRRILETGEGTEYVIEENEDGIQDFLQLIKRPVYDEDGRISGIIALINNITDYQLLKMELEKRAKTDALTGLLNKSAAQELIRMIMANYRKESERSALLMIDADRFKDINDTFGHAEGDKVLAEVGRIINNSCRAADVAGRIGGDEFIVFMRSIVEPENACMLADRLQSQVSRAFEGTALAGRVSLSIGIALCPEHGERFEALFKAADTALYLVKSRGRGAYRVY
jgi:diguanylate cyclase (GGDEF)-like protein